MTKPTKKKRVPPRSKGKREWRDLDFVSQMVLSQRLENRHHETKAERHALLLQSEVEFAFAREKLGVDFETNLVSEADVNRAIEDFERSFFSLLETVDKHVCDYEGMAEKLQEIDCPTLSNWFLACATRYAGVTTPIFQQAAVRVGWQVCKAFHTGYPDHVVAIEKHLAERARAEWGRQCAAQRMALVGDREESDWDEETIDDAQEYLASELVVGLSRIEPRAEQLSWQEVVRHAKRRKLQHAGFAAALACACGAFDYEPDDEQTAQRAIKKAMGKGIARRPL